MLGAGKRNPEIGNAAKKLEMLGLSDEVSCACLACVCVCLCLCPCLI